jgi:hypothetical protein
VDRSPRRRDVVEAEVRVLEQISGLGIHLERLIGEPVEVEEIHARSV